MILLTPFKTGQVNRVDSYICLEEKKVDHLVKQNEGGRKMTNQIVREIFRPRGNKEEKLAFGQGVSVFQAYIHFLRNNFPTTLCRSCYTRKYLCYIFILHKNSSFMQI